MSQRITRISHRLGVEVREGVENAFPSVSMLFGLMGQVREARGRVARELGTLLANEGGALEMEQRRVDGSIVTATLAVDPSNPARWRVERADAEGPFHHTCYTSVTDAIEDALREGFIFGAPAHQIEPVRVEVAVENGVITDVQARSPARVLTVCYDDDDVVPSLESGPVFRSHSMGGRGYGPHGVHAVHATRGTALERFAQLDELVRVAMAMVRLEIPATVLRPFVMDALRSGATACGRLPGADCADEAEALLQQCIAGERDPVDVLAVIKDGAQLPAIEAVLRDIEHVKRCLDTPSSATSQQFLLAWAESGRVTLAKDPDQPEWWLWRDAQGEGCEMSFPSRAVAAMDALQHLFPLNDFVAELGKSDAVRGYGDWIRATVAAEVDVEPIQEAEAHAAAGPTL